MKVFMAVAVLSTLYGSPAAIGESGAPGPEPVVYWDKAAAAPKGRMVVVLDPGHDPAEPGAMGTEGIAEVVFNDRLATQVGLALRDQPGVSAVVTRRPTELLGLKARAKRISGLAPDLVVSLHHDSVKLQFLTWKRQDGRELPICTEYSGYSIFAQARGAHSPTSRLLAGAISTGYRRLGLSHTTYHAMKIPGENRRWIDASLGIHAGDYLYLLRKIDAPVVLVESGFVVNPGDEARLRDPEHLRALAQKVAAAILVAATNAKSG